MSLADGARLNDRPISRLRATYGPCAVVTGASDGIGRAFARQLAAEGLSLALVARGRDGLERLADELRNRHGSEVMVIPLDLGAADAPARLLSATRDHDVGLLVAAAGFGSAGPFINRELSEELGMIDVNCRAVVALAHGFAQRLATRKRGGIVLMGSLVGWQGAPYAATYAATKAFIQSLAEGLRGELRPLGVDVVSCAPGPVRSGFGARAGMTMGAADPPEVVARAALAALGRRGTVVPGAIGKMLSASLAPLPRPVRVAIMGRIMRGMSRSGDPRDPSPDRQSA